MVVHCGQLGGSWNYVSFSDSINWFFFFLISKNDIYTKGNSMHEEYRANRENTRKGKQRETKKKTKQKKNYKKEREQRKEGRESLDVSPHARDQSK